MLTGLFSRPFFFCEALLALHVSRVDLCGIINQSGTGKADTSTPGWNGVPLTRSAPVRTCLYRTELVVSHYRAHISLPGATGMGSLWAKLLSGHCSGRCRRLRKHGMPLGAVLCTRCRTRELRVSSERVLLRKVVRQSLTVPSRCVTMLANIKDSLRAQVMELI